MRTAGAIAFRGQLQACANGDSELRSELRWERWNGAGWIGDRGERVGLSSTFWDSYNEWTSRFILYGGGFWFRFGHNWGYVFAYTPPLTTTRIRRRADEENKKHDPKPRRRRMTGVICLFIAQFTCVSVQIFKKMNLKHKFDWAPVESASTIFFRPALCSDAIANCSFLHCVWYFVKTLKFDSAKSCCARNGEKKWIQ